MSLSVPVEVWDKIVFKSFMDDPWADADKVMRLMAVTRGSYSAVQAYLHLDVAFVSTARMWEIGS